MYPKLLFNPVISAMAQPSSKFYFNQNILSVKNKEGLEIFEEQLFKENIKFKKTTDRFKKCINLNLFKKLYTFFKTLESAKGVGFF